MVLLKGKISIQKMCSIIAKSFVQQPPAEAWMGNKTLFEGIWQLKISLLFLLDIWEGYGKRYGIRTHW